MIRPRESRARRVANAANRPRGGFRIVATTTTGSIVPPLLPSPIQRGGSGAPKTIDLPPPTRAPLSPRRTARRTGGAARGRLRANLMGPSHPELYPRLVCRRLRTQGSRERSRVAQKRLRQRAQVDRFTELEAHRFRPSGCRNARSSASASASAEGTASRPGGARPEIFARPSDVSSVQCSIRPVGTGAR